jgi:hypothetical protein
MELERRGQQKQQRLGEVAVKNTKTNMWFNDFLICYGTIFLFFHTAVFPSRKNGKILTTERFFPEYLAYEVIFSTLPNLIVRSGIQALVPLSFFFSFLLFFMIKVVNGSLLFKYLSYFFRGEKIKILRRALVNEK